LPYARLIVNPVAGAGRTAKQWLEQVDLLATDLFSRYGLFSVYEPKEIFMHAWNGTRAELK